MRTLIWLLLLTGCEAEETDVEIPTYHADAWACSPTEDTSYEIPPHVVWQAEECYQEGCYPATDVIRDDHLVTFGPCAQQPALIFISWFG